MLFSPEELAAVTKLEIAMASADGVITDAEMNFIAYEALTLRRKAQRG